MPLEEIIRQGKDKFYDIIVKGATAFPYSSDLMHIGLIGILPFFVGKYGAELIGVKFPFLKEHSTALGFISSGISEGLWLTIIEPASPYAYQLVKRNLRGIAETGIGAGLAYLVTRLIR